MFSSVTLQPRGAAARQVTGLQSEFISAAARKQLAPDEQRKRLLLALFALGTNFGVKRIAQSGDQGVTEAQLRRARHLHVDRVGLRRAVAAVVGATLRARPALVGRPHGLRVGLQGLGMVSEGVGRGRLRGWLRSARRVVSAGVGR